MSLKKTFFTQKVMNMVKQNDFISFSELRSLFPSTDQIDKLTVFNISGNKLRLVAAIHYNRKKFILGLY